MYIEELNRRQVVQSQTDSHDLWGGGLPLEKRVNKLLRMLNVYGRNQFRVSGEVDARLGVIASHKWFALDISYGNKLFKTLGIGAVFTQEKSRKKGFAKQLLSDSVRVARSEGYELALLFSDIDPAYYEQMGFITLSATDYQVDIQALPKKDPLDLRPARAGDFTQMLEWYELSWNEDWLRMARSALSWTFMHERSNSAPQFILSEAGMDLGYLTMDFSDGKIRVEEFCAPGIDANRIWATIYQSLKQSKDQKLRGWWRSDQIGSEFEPIPRTKAIPMILPLQPFDMPTSDSVFFGSIDHF